MEDVLIVFIVFSFVTLFFGGIYKLIRAKMDSTGIDEDTFDRLARAFVQHKKDSNRRIQHLESMISDDATSVENKTREVESASTSIEVEDEDQRSSSKDMSNNLRNMLHEE